MTDTSARLGLPYLMPSQAQKHVTHNEALARLDSLVQLSVRGFGAETPPPVPTEGEIHALGPAPTGAWAGQAGRLAVFAGGAWSFVTPAEGWIAVAGESGDLRVFRAGAWTGARLDTLDRAGIGAAADATNRLSVRGAASLFSHDGAGHQVKLNKAAAGDTGSVLFQTGWSGRAEFGLTGSDALALKVSQDGSGWTTALSFDPATGLASGAAVQQGPGDTTPGRLMRADYGYGPGNLVGSVAQSGGVPTGAGIESGEGAAGRYTRFADGTQICAHAVSLGQSSGALCTGSWSFPAAFATAPHLSLTPGDISGATPPAGDMAPPRVAAITAAGADLEQARATGATDFAPGDTLILQVLAVGRWF